MSPGECSAAVAGVRVPETLRKRISSGANEHRTRNPSSSGGLTNSGFFRHMGARAIHKPIIHIVCGIIILSHSSNVVHQNQWKTVLCATGPRTHSHTCTHAELIITHVFFLDRRCSRARSRRTAEVRIRTGHGRLISNKRACSVHTGA